MLHNNALRMDQVMYTNGHDNSADPPLPRRLPAFWIIFLRATMRTSLVGIWKSKLTMAQCSPQVWCFSHSLTYNPPPVYFGIDPSQPEMVAAILVGTSYDVVFLTLWQMKRFSETLPDAYDFALRDQSESQYKIPVQSSTIALQAGYINLYDCGVGEKQVLPA